MLNKVVLGIWYRVLGTTPIDFGSLGVLSMILPNEGLLSVSLLRPCGR